MAERIFETNELRINGKLIAKYSMNEKICAIQDDGRLHGLLHLKIFFDKPDDLPMDEWEEYIAGMICLVENIRYSGLSYLNVD